MSVSFLPSTYVEVPPPAVAGGGILGAARVIPPQSSHQLGGAQYLTDACADGHVWLDLCADIGGEGTNVKSFAAAPELVESYPPFAVYAGVGCDLARPDESMERARSRLAFTERHQIDNYVVPLMEQRALGLGGPYPLSRAIGVLENYAANVYGGVPVLVVPRTLIPAAAEGGMIVPSLGGGMVTSAGTPVANVDTDPFDESLTLLVSGQITLLQGPMIEALAPAGGIQADGTAANPSRALVERLYVVLVECMVGRVEVCDGVCADTGAAAPPVPTAISLSPDTASIANTPEFELRVNGTNFTPGCVILFNNAPQPTRFGGTGVVGCQVDPSTAFGPITVPVAVRCGDQTTAPLNFTFTA